MALACAPFHNDQTYDHGSHYAHRRSRHGQGEDLVVAELAEGLTYRCGRAVASAVACRHRYAEAGVEGPDAVEEQQPQQSAQSPLEEHPGLRVGPHHAHGAALTFLDPRRKREAPEDKSYQDARVGACLIRQRQPAQSVGAEHERQKTGDETWRDKELLHQPQLDAHQLPQKEERRDYTYVDEERPGGEVCHCESVG